VLNTIVAESFRQFCDVLEKAPDFNAAVEELIKDTLTKHYRIIFNGNGYSAEWKKEAARRGLLNLKTSVDAFKTFAAEKHIELFSRHGVFSESEMRARREIQLENYTKIIHIEALTMLDMARHDILPAASDYAARVAANAELKAKYGSNEAERKLLCKLCTLTDSFYSNIERLEAAVKTGEKNIGKEGNAMFYKNEVIGAMNALRADGDALEELCDSAVWPYPSYGDMLFSIK
jgi:glutamine synthetase